MTFEVREAGDSALVLVFPERIDPVVNARCLATAHAIRESLGTAVRDVVIGYCTVTVYFDPIASDPGWVEERVREAGETAWVAGEVQGAEVEVPVCYGGDFGPDLEDVARFAACSADEVIALHAQTEYRVYLVGFVPGFAYMATVPPAIAAPRRSTPRTAVPAGSVAIAGGQTGVYPSVTPGGWNIIGRTPVKPYDPHRADPFLFRPGDRVRFRPVHESEFGALAAA